MNIPWRLMRALLVAVAPAPTTRRRKAAMVVLAQAVLLGAAGVTFAQTDAAEPLAVLPERIGYAFDQPRILAQQRLLGVAHGVSLLVSACMDLPDRIDATLAAYVPWREREEALITRMQTELARHYFGARASEARWPDLVRALNLKNQIDLAPGSPELAAACETLPAALQRPRYALGEQFRLHGLLAEATAGLEADLRWNWCSQHLEGDDRTLLDFRYAVWREINAPRMAQAATVLDTAWPVDAPAASFAEWREDLRGVISLHGDTSECRAFSEQLKDPRTAVRRVFAPVMEAAP